VIFIKDNALNIRARAVNLLAVFACCVYPLLSLPGGGLTSNPAAVLTLLAGAAAGTLCLRLPRYAAYICLPLMICAAVWPSALPVLPVAAYSLGGGAGGGRWLRFLWLAPLLPALIVSFPAVIPAISTLPPCVLAMLLRVSEDGRGRLISEYHIHQDETARASSALRRRNTDLIEARESSARLAALEERQRIAREIHDNVGHMLTRSILQITALMVVRGDDDELLPELAAVKQTLSETMDSVRQSVHGLHDDAMDMRARLSGIVGEFTFCPVTLRYDAGEMPREVKRCLLAAVKEALSNIARHSGASGARISLLEHPGMYQLVVEDNGRGLGRGDTDDYLSRGIGLSGLSDRVDSLGGIFRADSDNGFRVFISIPKATSGFAAKNHIPKNNN